jgi:hypothetical protein
MSEEVYEPESEHAPDDEPAHAFDASWDVPGIDLECHFRIDPALLDALKPSFGLFNLFVKQRLYATVPEPVVNLFEMPPGTVPPIIYDPLGNGQQMLRVRWFQSQVATYQFRRRKPNGTYELLYPETADHKMIVPYVEAWAPPADPVPPPVLREVRTTGPSLDGWPTVDSTLYYFLAAEAVSGGMSFVHHILVPGHATARINPALPLFEGTKIYEDYNGLGHRRTWRFRFYPHPAPWIEMEEPAYSIYTWRKIVLPDSTRRDLFLPGLP